MTVTIRSVQDSAPRWRRRVVRAAASVATAFLVLTAVPALAATPTPSPTPSIPARSGSVEVALSPVNQGVFTVGAPLTVSVSIDNGTAGALPTSPVTLAVSAAPLPDRATLADWLGSDAGDANADAASEASDIPMQDIATTPAEPVAIDASTTLGIMVAADDPALATRLPGVYALRAIYAGPDGPVVATSALIVPDPAAAATQVAVVVPITAPPTAAGLLTVDELTALTAPQGSLTTQLEAVTGTSAIVAVDPAIVAAIRVLGSSAPDSATAWLDALLALPNSRFALQFGDADVAVQMDAGLPQPLQPLSLQSYMSPQNFAPVTPTASPTASGAAPTNSPTPAPTPDATPGTPSDPTDTDPIYADLASLLNVDATRAGVFWPLGGSATAASIDALATLGDTENPAITVISSTSTEQGQSGATVGARGATEAGSSVLVYDAGISAALRRASQTDIGALRGASLTEATALLSFAARDAGGAPLLVTLDRPTTQSAADTGAGSDARSRVSIGTAISVISDAPAVDIVPLETLIAAQTRPLRVVDAAADPARVAAVAPLVADEVSLTDFSTILDTPEVLTGPERASMLQLLSAAWAQTPNGWMQAFDEHREQTIETLNAVSIQFPSTIQLLSPGADLRFFVTNELAFPVNLVLFAEPDNLRLSVQDQTPVTATADSNTAVTLPVEARVGNGDVTISLQLRSPTGVVIGGAQSADVTVRADWEAIGLTIMGVLVGGLLVVGVVRTLLRRRNADDSAGGDATADGDTGTEPHATPERPAHE